MNRTLFIRLLHHENKGAGLAEKIAALREGRVDGDVYAVAPESFRQVPNTPFCYWVSDRIRSLFTELPPFESKGRTVKVGLQTGDDFRFVRAWWEVPSGRILDSGRWGVERGQRSGISGQGEKWTEEKIKEIQSWYRKRIYEGKRWVPFAKGGEYSPYYTDIHLVVNWEKEGAEMKGFPGSVIRNPDYYFRPGLTWPLRARRFAPQIMPKGSIFSVRGYSAFPEIGFETSTLGMFNSSAFDYIFKTALGRFGFPEFIVGILQVLPWRLPFIKEDRQLNTLAESQWTSKRSLDTINENSHAFTVPALLQAEGATLAERVAAVEKWFAEIEAKIYKNQSEIDEVAFDLYGFTKEERKAVIGGQESMINDEFEEHETAEDQEADETVSIESRPLTNAQFVSWCVGVAFGRFDVRIALDLSLSPKLPDPFDRLPVCSPAMLVGSDGLPAEPNRIVSDEWLRARPDTNALLAEDSGKNPTIPDQDYMLRIAWGGIFVDDTGFNGNQLHRDDIVLRVREVLDLLWKDKAHDIEQEVCDILDVSDLRDYFCKPAGFFQDHLKRYSKSRRKAPIYWPLSTASGSYTLWLYYHRLTDQTLYAAVNKYVEPKIVEVERGITHIEDEVKSTPGREATRLTDRLNESRTFLGELRELREELLRIAALPFKPDLNDGVIINAAPFHKLFRLRSWANDTEDCWQKLEKGDYDWAHLAYTIWPDRVREVCKTDRSIAIAHGLEDLCEVEAHETNKKVGPGRRKKEIIR
jgi:hypothetical protein